MPPLRDEAIIARFRLAFVERTSGGVQWKRVPTEWVLKNLECQPKAIDELLRAHIDKGEPIKQVQEKHDGHRDCHQYHYDFECR